MMDSIAAAACKAMLISFLGTTTPGHVINIPAARLAGYTQEQIASAKQCARDNGVRWRIVRTRRWK